MEYVQWPRQEKMICTLIQATNIDQNTQNYNLKQYFDEAFIMCLSEWYLGIVITGPSSNIEYRSCGIDIIFLE